MFVHSCGASRAPSIKGRTGLVVRLHYSHVPVAANEFGEHTAILSSVLAACYLSAAVLLQDLTEKWQQSIAENAWLNRENIQLRNSLTQLNSLVAGTTGAAGPAVGAAAAAAGGSSAPGGSAAAVAAAAEGMGVLGSLALGLNLPLHGISSTQG